MNKILLALDGGATKTAMTVYDQDGYALFEATTTGSNYQAIGQQNVIDVLSNLLSDAASQLHEWHIDAAVFAIAGVDTKKDEEIVRHIIETSIAASPLKIEHYVIENDVEATLKGLLANEPGALLISGTGAIAYGYDGHEPIRAGGWGHRAGDEGSGYWVGQQVARAIFKAADGRAPSTLLKDLVLQLANLQTVEELYNYLYNDTYTNARLASFGSVLQKACDQHDETAKAIAQLAADELLLLASSVLHRLQITEGFTFYLNGGVLKNNACIYEPFKAQFRQLYPTVQVLICEEQPLYYLHKRAQLLANIKTHS